MNQIKSLILILLLAFAFTGLHAQKVTNIQPKLVGNNMEITYEITGAEFNQKFMVELFVSTDGGKTFNVIFQTN